jgi:DNA-binding response OmpR family regulator
MLESGNSAIELTSTAGPCRRLLLVEDDDAVSCGISALLEMEGIDVRIAREGRGVVQAIHEFSPDAIVLDVTLPDISGVTVFESIRKIWPRLPVIISTGQMCDPSVFDLELQPHTEFLMKPYASAELLDRIGRTVAS